ncbi:MAG: glycosyltransferase family 39 protein [Anaerolineae bacterium]|nr:glycosyltransferase family 39 protein [Anaerolineae bacterium]
MWSSRLSRWTQEARARLTLIVLAVTLLAALLRAYKIDAQSFWYDEGNSARLAERSVQLIIEGAAGDIHPPLYYLLLKYWRAVFGESEAALRALSALASTLTTVFVFALGRRLFSARVGLIASGLWAGSPFAIYYAQEARMYALLGLWAAASSWALVLWAQERKRAAYLTYVAATAAGLYTHYAYPFVIAAQLLCALLAGWRQRDERSVALRTVGGTVGMVWTAGLLYLPWLPTALARVSSWETANEPVALSTAASAIYRVLVVGHTASHDEARAALILWGALATAGVLVGSQGWTARLWLVALCGAPIAGLLILGVYRETYLKFLLISLAPFLVLVARGLVSLIEGVAARTRWASGWGHTAAQGAGALLLVASVAPSLHNLYDNPRYARDDYRGLQRLIASQARAEDAVIFLAPNQWEVYTYYQRDDRNLYPLRYRPPSYEAVGEQMRAISADHPRLFALYYAEHEADPDGWYERWLGEHTYKAHERWVGNIRFAVYAAPRAQAMPTDRVSYRFGNDIELVEAVVPFSSAARRGEVIPVQLVWRAHAPIPGRYKVFVHIGAEDAPPVAQFDGEPAHGYRPTNTWHVGELIVDRRGVWLAEVSAEAETEWGVFIGLYDAESGARLPISREGTPVGDRLRIAEVRFLP